MKIGVFDSGVGGLSVLKSLLDSKLFSEIIYYGDTARVPYGNKDKGTIVRFSLECVDFFIPHKIDMLIVACNTVSAYALNQMQEIAPFPVIGVVESGVLSLSNKIKNKKDSILIIATKATIQSGVYEKNLRKLGYENIISLQTGLFVPLVEEGIVSGEILEATMRYYFEGNSPLELHSADSANFECSQTPSLVSHSKFAENYESQTENSSVVDSLHESKDKKTPSLRGVANAEAIQKNKIDCHDSAVAKSRNDAKKGAFAIPDAIILGCTHFPLIANPIRAFFDNKPILIHSGEAIVEFLKQKYTLSSSHKLPKVHFYASGDKSTLESYAKLWLNS